MLKATIINVTDNGVDLKPLVKSAVAFLFTPSRLKYELWTCREQFSLEGVQLLVLKENTNSLAPARSENGSLERSLWCSLRATCSGFSKSSLGTSMNSASENASESSCLSTVLQKLPVGGGRILSALIKIFSGSQNTFFSLSLFLFMKDFLSFIISSCSVVGVPQRCQIQVDRPEA